MAGSLPTGTKFRNRGDCVSTGAHGGPGVTPDPSYPDAEQACQALSGGYFSVDNEDNLFWDCSYNSPPESDFPDSLNNACINEAGGTLITQGPVNGKVDADCTT
jgi:hypothetical protein